MPNPPQTIGPFANVPAPGSPIRSDWPIQVSQYLANKAAQNVRTTDLALPNAAWTTVASITGGGYRAGRYLVDAILQGATGTATQGSIRIVTAAGVTESHWQAFSFAANSQSHLVAVLQWIYVLPADGSLTVNLQANPTQAGLTAKAGSGVRIAFVGY